MIQTLKEKCAPHRLHALTRLPQPARRWMVRFVNLQRLDFIPPLHISFVTSISVHCPLYELSIAAIVFIKPNPLAGGQVARE